MNFKAALCSNEASSSCNSHRSRAVERASKGLHFPNKTVPDNVSNDPYYVFILTNVKTFDELFGTKCESRSESKKFVIHSLRLFKEPVRNSPPYDNNVDKLYSEKFDKISPGLSEKRKGLDHRKHQYEKHGHLLGLTQEQYFQKMIDLYDDFNFNAKLQEINCKIRKKWVKTSKHKWVKVDTDTHDNMLKSKFNDNSPGIMYAQDENGNKFVYEYKLYLNKNFNIMNAPKALGAQTLKEPLMQATGNFKDETFVNERV